MVGTRNWNSRLRHQVLTYAPNNTKPHVLHGVLSWRIRGGCFGWVHQLPRMRWKPLNMASKDPTWCDEGRRSRSRAWVGWFNRGDSLTESYQGYGYPDFRFLPFTREIVWHGCFGHCILKEKTFPFLRNIVILSSILQILAHLDREVGPTNMVICWTFRRGSLFGSTFLPFRVLPGHLDFYWSLHHSPRSSIKTLGQKF